MLTGILPVINGMRMTVRKKEWMALPSIWVVPQKFSFCPLEDKSFFIVRKSVDSGIAAGKSTGDPDKTRMKEEI